MKIQLMGFVHLIFPELENFFRSGIHIAACYSLLKEFPAPEDIAALRSDKLTYLLSKASHGRFGRDTAIAESYNEIDSVIKSVPGVGYVDAAWQLSLHNETFMVYYDLKRSQGLNHYGALGHVAHKFVRVLFNLLRDEIPFISDKLSA